MEITAEHNLLPEELSKALHGIAEAEGIAEDLVKALRKTSACDETPKLPRDKAIRHLYEMLQAEFSRANRDIMEYAAEIAAVPLHKAVGSTAAMTHDQLLKLQQTIEDRYGFIAAQLQSVDYLPDPQQLERWKRLGLVEQSVTPETFASTVPAEMHLIRNAFVIGGMADAIEQGTSFEEAMRLALNMPLLKPDLAAIQIAEQQTAMYLTDNAKDLATKVGQLAIKKRNEQIRQMAIDFHARKLKRTVLDEGAKREAGEEIPERYVENWQQFKSELYHTLNEKDRDLDRVAFYEITDAQKQGQAQRLLADGKVDKYVYKRPVPTACAQCKHLYLEKDGKTPKIFKLSEMINQGTNIGCKAHPTKGGKVVPGGRPDGAQTLKAVAGLVHCWCQCLGPFTATGYEDWMTPEQKRRVQGTSQK